MYVTCAGANCVPLVVESVTDTGQSVFPNFAIVAFALQSDRQGAKNRMFMSVVAISASAPADDSTAIQVAVSANVASNPPCNDWKIPS
jgi:hypothetical protein